MERLTQGRVYRFKNTTPKKGSDNKLVAFYIPRVNHGVLVDRAMQEDPSATCPKVGKN